MNQGISPAAYVEKGWALCSIPHGLKGPNHSGWNKSEQAIRTVADATSIQGNVGLLHAYSHTCSLDVDDYEGARKKLLDEGIDLDALLTADDAVQIKSGKPNRAKLIYQLPFVIHPLPGFKIKHDNHDLVDFRCGTAGGLTVQDVLPPSIHPDTGKPYEWVGDWSNLPTIPDELLSFWQKNLADKGASSSESVAVPDGFKSIALETLNLSEHTRELILYGDTEGVYQSRSEVIYGVLKDLVRAKVDDSTICRIMADPGNSISEKALVNANGNIKAAMRWVANQLPKIRRKVEKELPLENFNLGSATMPDITQFTLTDEEVMKLENTKMLVPGMLPSGHIVNWVGAAGSGKTAIAMHMCRYIAEHGNTIWYINADTAPDAAKAYIEAVRDLPEFHLILPDLKGVSMEEVQATINAHIQNRISLENTVIVFDTLKKAVDMMSKRGLREFYKWARQLAALKATVILLGHTNKHKAPDGSLIFEGTGDIRNDTDELFYLDSAKQDDGSQIVTVTPDKVRAFGIEPVTFTIHKDWTVTRNTVFIDVRAMSEALEQRKKDEFTINAIKQSIADLAKKGLVAIQQRIIDELNGTINHKTIKRVLGQQEGALWKFEPGVNNSKIVKPL